MTSTPSVNDPLVSRLHAAQALIEAGKLPEAAKKLNQARSFAPNDPRVYLLGMLLAEASDNPQGALQSGRRALELAPDWPVAVTELGLLFARLNQFDDAIALAQRAVALDGSNPALLGRVIDIAHRARRLDLAIEWLERAVQVAPEHQHIKYLLARDLAQRGEHDRALLGLEPLLAANPDDPTLLICRLKSLLALERRDEAKLAGERLAALDPENAEYCFWRDLAQGEVAPKYPQKMVEELYDGFAEVFDHHLETLKYDLPRDVAAKIKALHPDNQLNVLDLGCGTGLLGASLGRINGGLVGVELSLKMIEQAGHHGVYDRFHNVDLVEALQATPENLYEVITALDVFIYVGDLAAAIPGAFGVLKPDGHFFFSCETAQETEDDLVFRSSLRYAHKASHVEALCRQAGFEDVTLENRVLRTEGAQQVLGYLVTARKPKAA